MKVKLLVIILLLFGCKKDEIEPVAKIGSVKNIRLVTSTRIKCPYYYQTTKKYWAYSKNVNFKVDSVAAGVTTGPKFTHTLGNISVLTIGVFPCDTFTIEAYNEHKLINSIKVTKDTVFTWQF